MAFTGRSRSDWGRSLPGHAGSAGSGSAGQLDDLSDLGRAAGRMLGAWAESLADAAAEFSIEGKLDELRASLECAPKVRQAVDEVEAAEVFDALLPAGGDDAGKPDEEELSTQDGSSDHADSITVAADAETPTQEAQSPALPDLITLEPVDLISFEAAAAPDRPEEAAAFPVRASGAAVAASPADELADVFGEGAR